MGENQGVSESNGRGWPVVASVILCIAAVWMLLAPVLGHMGPPWPCAIAGGLLLVAAAMMHQRPNQSTGWGIAVVIVSVLVALIGQRAVIPGLIGLAGGIAAIVWRPGTASG